MPRRRKGEMATRQDRDTPDEITDRVDRPSPVDLTEFNNQELLAIIEEAIDRLNVEDLTAVMNAAEERRRDKQEEIRERLIQEFRERADRAGIPLEVLFPSYGRGARRQRRDAGQPLPVKYRGPQGETWSGRGHPPRWITDLEATGRNREEFRVPVES